MGASALAADASLRASLGWNSTAEDADYFLRKWAEVYNRIRNRHSREGGNDEEIESL